MAIHGPLYWKQKAEDLREINNNLSGELSRAKNKWFTAERKMYDLERAKFRIEDELSKMCSVGWRVEAILHCLSGLEFAKAIDTLVVVQERLERDRDKSHVKCE